MNKLVDALRYLASLCEKEASDLSSAATATVALFDLHRALGEVETLALAFEEHSACEFDASESVESLEDRFDRELENDFLHNGYC